MKPIMITKKMAAITLSLILLNSAFTPAISQNMFDAYRYSQQFNEGTARSVAMGNAFVALGGDMGAISINPASSGVYTYTELAFTPSITVADNNTTYLGNTINSNKTRFGVPNFGFVSNFNTYRSRGLVSWSLGVTFNKSNNYTNRMSASGISTESSYLQSIAQGLQGTHATNLDMNPSTDPFAGGAPWQSILAWNTSLLDTLPDSGSDYFAATENLDSQTMSINLGGPVHQSYYREQIGNTSEIILNFGGNISNKFFFGFNLGIVNLWYKYNELYTERAVNVNDFNSGFSSFSRQYSQKTSGTGINLKAGLIFLPTSNLRIGASISTPTWFYLTEEWEERVTSDFTDGYSQSLLSPLGRYEYRLNTPFRWNLGIAYTLGSFAVISADYESVNYSKMKLNDYDYPTYFAEENSAIKNNFTSADIFRVGAEINYFPQMALRIGYQYYNEGYRGDNLKTNIGSVGLGYTANSGFFIDAAYQQSLKRRNEEFTLYDDIIYSDGAVAAPKGVNEFLGWRVLVTVGIKW